MSDASGSLVIDVHNHFIPDAYWSAVDDRVATDHEFAELARRNNLVPQAPDGPMRTLGVRIDEMDNGGVDIAVLSLPPPGAAIRNGASELVAKINDDLVAAAGTYPDRFRVLCALPLPDIDASRRELDRACAADVVRGVGVTTNVQEWQLDDPELDPVYADMAARDLPLFTHPALEPLPPAYADFALVASMSAVVSSTLGVLRMIYSGTLDRVPGLTVIMPHLGGTIPYLLQRLMDLGGQQRAAEPLDHYVTQRLVFDTCSYHPPAFRCALETVGVGRLALGTDFPFRGTLKRAVDDVRAHGLPAIDEAAVLGRNVEHWFA
jgi:predicted TIM-barrel fold metal-dependent hydrolase